MLVLAVEEAVEDRPGVVERNDERFVVVEHGEAELPGIELPEVGDLILAVPAEALVVARRARATEHYVWLEVFFVLGHVGVDALNVPLEDKVRGSSLRQARQPPREP
eukprot:13637974-Alexandrium_andersonii.AAC.1